MVEIGFTYNPIRAKKEMVNKQNEDSNIIKLGNKILFTYFGMNICGIIQYIDTVKNIFYIEQGFYYTDSSVGLINNKMEFTIQYCNNFMNISDMQYHKLYDKIKPIINDILIDLKNI